MAAATMLHILGDEDARVAVVYDDGTRVVQSVTATIRAGCRAHVTLVRLSSGVALLDQTVGPFGADQSVSPNVPGSPSIDNYRVELGRA